MSLKIYKKKRSFKETSEPQGGKSANSALRFVVQKHDASHLHYDFRLELGGVLVSWAIPKGPTLDPAIKRLAMKVEDHPFEYKNFEGIIPKGQYGGGTVIVWDEGTYEPITALSDKKTQEKELLKELKKGSVKVILHGKKLKGEFALVKTNGMGENAWLLIKNNDQYASKNEITLKDKSVISKKTIAQVAKTTSNIYSNHTQVPKTVKVTATSIENELEKENIQEISSKKDLETKFYTTVKPMLATLVDQPFDNDDWIYEIKWDGYRAIAFINDGKVSLKSRNNQSFTEKFIPITSSLKNWGINAIVDGEIVVLDEKGKTNFGALQNWKSDVDGELFYYVFDLLWYNGHDLKELPLVKRRTLLRKMIPENSIIRFSENFETSATEFLETARKIGLEGIMAKQKDSLYEAGHRTKNWLKIKINKRHEVIIGGYTVNDDTPKPFSALLVGVMEKNKFVYLGKVGTGFSIKDQQDMLMVFKDLIVEKSQFDQEPNFNKRNKFNPVPANTKAYWLRPELICEVSYTELTADGLMRHPTFEGMRNDKKVKDVQLEKEEVSETLVKHKQQPKSTSLKKELNNLFTINDNIQIKKVQNHELKFTNLDKIYWPKEKITKRDLLNYYSQIAPFILPYLKNRPQSLNRHPNGITGHNFYQKDITGKVPDWIKTYLYHTDESDVDKHFLVGENEATLLYMVNLGCIEINPWSSTIKKPDYPTWCIIDLDPAQNSFAQVIEAAQVTKQICDDMAVPCYCKTSGSTGLHIYIPLGNKYTYEQSKEFARIIVTLLHRELPKYTSVERNVAARNGKMYLDFLQNRAQATIASPYSVRPKPGATVSMPLHWDEVKKGLKMTDFTIKNAISRVQELGDIFYPVLQKGIDLKKIITLLKEK